MPKDFRIRADQFKPLAIDCGACFASDAITVDGHKVGYMYRNEPGNESDSGWVFMAGNESQEYLDEPDNFGIYEVNTIANYDPNIIPLLDAPIGSAYARNSETGRLEEESITAPIESSALTGHTTVPEVPTNPDFCDQCGRPLEFGEFEIRSKTDSELVGVIAFHRSVHLALCRKCAGSHDDTASGISSGLAIFVAVMVFLGLVGWLLSFVIR